MAEENLVLGRGELYFDRFVPRTFVGSGERYFGNTTDLSLTQASTKLDHYDSDHGLKVKNRSVTLSSDLTGKFATDDVSDENLALWFMGDVSTQVVAPVAAPGLTDTFLNVQKGRVYQMDAGDAQPTGGRNLVTAVVKTGATPVAAAAAAALADDGTNYVFDGLTGMLAITDNAPGITAGQAIVVTYGQTGYTKDTVISKGQEIFGALRFKSFNAEGLDRDFFVPYAMVMATGDYAWKGDTWQTMNFTFDVLKLRSREKLYIEGRVVI